MLKDLEVSGTKPLGAQKVATTPIKRVCLSVYVYDDDYKIAFLCSRTPIHETLIHETLGSLVIMGRKLILEFKIPET